MQRHSRESFYLGVGQVFRLGPRNALAGFDQQQRAGCAIGEVSKFLTGARSKCSAFGSETHDVRVALGCGNWRVGTAKNIGHLFQQLCVLFAIPRLIEVILLVQFLLIDKRQNRHSPTERIRRGAIKTTGAINIVLAAWELVKGIVKVVKGEAEFLQRLLRLRLTVRCSLLFYCLQELFIRDLF